MPKPLFDDTALKTQVERIADTTPRQQVHGGVVAENGDIGAVLEANVALGKSGAFVAGEASWMKRTGYRVAAMFGWKGKSH
jgi:hypothetical protein